MGLRLVALWLMSDCRRAGYEEPATTTDGLTTLLNELSQCIACVQLAQRAEFGWRVLGTCPSSRATNGTSYVPCAVKNWKTPAPNVGEGVERYCGVHALT